MVKRNIYPTRYDGYDISLAVEQMKDGRWSVVANVRHHADGSVQTTPLPVTHHRFDTEQEAHAFGMAQASEYLDRSAPAA